MTPMQDKILGLLIFVPVAIIVLLVLSMVLLDYLEGELESFGLSERAEQYIRERVSRR